MADCVALRALRDGADLKGIAFISSQVVLTHRISPSDEKPVIEIIRIYYQDIARTVVLRSPAVRESSGVSTSARPQTSASALWRVMAAVHHQDGVNLDADDPVETVRIAGNPIPHGESLARGSAQGGILHRPPLPRTAAR